MLRHKPPSLCSVTLKAMVVYLFSIVVFAINNYLEKMAMTQKYIEFEDRKSDQISLSILICNILVTYIVPIGFFFYVWIIVKVRNFLPSVSGREKELVSIVSSLFKVFGLSFFQFIGLFCFSLRPVLLLLFWLFVCTIDVILFPRCCMFLRLLVTGNVLGDNWNDAKFWDLRLYWSYRIFRI